MKKRGNEIEDKKAKKKIGFPDTYVLIFGLMALALLLTYVIPAGSFTRIEEELTGQLVVQPRTYERVEQSPVPFLDLFMAVPQGMQKNAMTVFFIFVIGGCFGIVNATGTIDGLIRKVIYSKTRRISATAIVGMLVITFGLAGGVVGMAEECLAFLPILLTLAVGLGFDPVVGVAILIIGNAYGYGSAPINPFTVGLAQSISGLPIFSGMWFRWILWICSTVLAVGYIAFYCRKIKKDPSKSIVSDLDSSQFKLEEQEQCKFSIREKGVLICFFGGILLLMVMIVWQSWYMTELTAYFFGLAILCGLVYGMSPNAMAQHFVAGMKDMIYPAILVGMAAGISILLEKGHILDTIVYAISKPLEYIHPTFNGGLMMLVQTFINLFIPSGTGQAVVTMPLMAPLADVVGITRQTAVLAYQLGDGCSNSIIPTSSMTMAALSMAKIPYTRWVKFVSKWLVLQLLLGFVFCVIAGVIHLGPF